MVAAAIFVADRSGRVSIEWSNSIIETSTAILVAAVALLVLAGIFTMRMVDRVRAIPGAYRRHQQLQYHHKAHRILTQAVEAAALEKPGKASRLVKRAEKMLGPSHLIDMVKTQVAPASIDGATEPVSPYAWREAVTHELRAGNLGHARDLAQRFVKKHPDLPQPKRLLLDIYLQSGEWSQALDALDQLRVGHILSRKEIRQIRAAIYTERAREAVRDGNPREAFEWAMQADRLRSAWVPAIYQAVAALAQQDRPKEAAHLISQMWPGAAHAQLGEAFLGLKTGRNEIKMAQEAEKLARKSPDHPASHALIAKAATRAGLWGEARRHAELWVREEPCRSAYHLLARIAETERDKPAAEQAARLAADAQPDAAWICDLCKQPHAQWQVQCMSCKGFDSLRWGTPLHVKTTPPLIAAIEPHDPIE